ncbi:O-antigen ligase family protein [Chromohalobacter canadensis]|uniref:O-antigen ligase family protein n=1 Tax=Chromohalobacter canadensis TaxID=141389 RepID=A0ABZ0YAW7_9GAMM|nr:O-antigen ligase family protein [Chromohalobacter canadensis]MCK0770257.1 O-antigen ligase family protein [Chromohalobacter canadensis]WQH08934.1 O-antigen ligase family protein [Chromohalobacter canadensis]
MRTYTSVAVWLLGAVALVIPSGYSLGALLLLLGSAVLLFTRPRLALSRQDKWIMLVMLAFCLTGLWEIAVSGEALREFDRPSRFLLAIPVLLLVMAYPPRFAFLWSGLVVGALGAGGWAGWQKLVEGTDRATGYTYVIQFGDISMLLGILCLAGLGWALAQPQRKSWCALLLLGALGGLLGSLFSGSRGGWVGLPFVFLVLYRAYGGLMTRRTQAVLAVLCVVGVATVYAIPQMGVQHRVNSAFSDIAEYAAGGGQTSSLGARFEMWQGASRLVAEKPLVGWGETGYRQGMERLAEEGIVNSRVAERYGHPHNELLNAQVKQGVLGLVILLALYLVPLKLFARELRAPDMSLRALATAGTLLPVAYIDFGLTQSLMEHNSGAMVYAFWLAVLWGCFQAKRKSLPMT